jgi:rhamnosyltransferase
LAEAAIAISSRAAGTTGVVVVFYRPEVDCVRRANHLAKLAPRVVVVDNSEEPQSRRELGLDDAILLITNRANLGVATAINQGVRALIDHGCVDALVFDQDSEPSEQLILELPSLLELELVAGHAVAVIGPAYEDARLGGVAPFVRFGFGRLRRITPVNDTPIEVDFLISSGSCFNLRVWDDVGPMEDALFIDFVDLEWCVRARARGYSVLGAPSVRLTHELGGKPVKVFGRAYPGHSPLRHYYLFRNAVALIKRRYVPCRWKINELGKMPFRLLIYGMFMEQRAAHLRMSVVGAWHGLIGHLGPYVSPAAARVSSSK